LSLQNIYKVDEVFYVDELVSTLKKLNEGIEKLTLYLLNGLNTDSNRYSKPADFQVRSESTRCLEIFFMDL
jgi:Xaa-Pro dipeptidase